MKIRFIQKLPTPYNDHLFRAIHEDGRIDLQVYYLWKNSWRRPWKTDLATGYPACFMDVKAKVDWKLRRQAAAERDSLWIVGDWAHAATVSVILSRLAKGLPVGLRVDTPQEQLVRRQPKKWLRETFLNWLIPRMSVIFATSEPAFRQLRKMGARNEQLIDFPFYVPLEFDESEEAAEQAVSSLRASVGCERPNDVVFCTMGTIVPKKGMDIALRAFREAFQQRQNIGMLIAGAGPQQEELEQYVADHGIQDRVNFMGWLEPAEVRTAVLAANAVIHAARYDPFPVAIMDTMSVGRPVIGSDVCGSVEARVIDWKNGVSFPTEDVDALTKIIEKVAAQPNLLTEMGIEARKTAEEWPVSRGVDTVVQVLERVAPRSTSKVRTDACTSSS